MEFIIEITGKFGTALIFTDELEESSRDQIQRLMDHESTFGVKVRIMPDVHAGAGCVIGYTATLSDKIIPNLIGVDIGCGVTAWKLGKSSPDYKILDNFIRTNIPNGYTINEEPVIQENLYRYLMDSSSMTYSKFLKSIKDICDNQKQDYSYVLRSAGSLGSGNHFIEVDKDNKDQFWLVIHSGSRNFGLKIADFHQKRAEFRIKEKSEKDLPNLKEIIKRAKESGETKDLGLKLKQARKKIAKNTFKATGLEFLKDNDSLNYINDMRVAQLFAKLNRRIMGYKIIRSLQLEYENLELVESVHNYIDFEDKIVRKGAIAAHKGQKLLIPLNMADGIILGEGKGNDDWNNSAPHGAGRVMSRKQAKKKIKLATYRESMKDIWSSCISTETLDEAPQVYKDSSKIINHLKPTVKIRSHMKPVYNFKAETKRLY